MKKRKTIMRSLEDKNYYLRKNLGYGLRGLVVGLLIGIFLLAVHPVQASSDPAVCKVDTANDSASTSNKIDLGAGYTLVNGCDGWSVVPPPSTVKVYTPVSTSMDLGAGYTLITDSYGTRIVPPPSMLKPQDQTLQANPPVVQKIDIGDGYQLQLWADGGQIVKVSP
jgi:hypothetical protein